MSRSPRESFRTHTNYLRAFAYLASRGNADRSGAFRSLRRRVEASGSLPDGRRADADIATVHNILRNAWGTELLLALGESVIEEDELVRLSNNWSVVQTYYVAYHATQALAVAKGFVRPDSHPKTQRQFTDFWAARPIEIAPWTLAATSGGFANIPASIQIDDGIHAWTACTHLTSWSLCCKALRTTRQDEVDAAFKRKREAKRRARRNAWRQEEDDRLRAGRRPRKEPTFRLPRLTPSEKANVESSVRPYTLIDYLYRLRIRTNYEDATMFTDGPEDDRSSVSVRSDLCLIASTTLFLHELYIAVLVGQERFRQWVDEWVNDNVPALVGGGLVERFDLLCDFCS